MARAPSPAREGHALPYLRQRTGLGVLFDLDGGMFDSKRTLQVFANIVQKCIAPRRGRHDEMRRQRHLRSAHRPNVKIVHRGDIGQIR
jgi:hypothetical protein